jgi:TPR repeat protein
LHFVTIEDAKSLPLLQQFARGDQREAIAQYNLGVMYGKGQGVPRDYAEAIKWFREAAEQGKAGSREGSNSYEHNQTARRLPVRITSV